MSNQPPIPAPKTNKPELRLHPRQFEVFRSQTRFRVLVAGRRFGKTELALAEIVKAATAAPNRLVWYVGPSDKFAKRVFWRRLKHITQLKWASKPNESERRIDLRNGSSIVVKGAFDPDSLRGEGLDFVVLDEVADLKPSAWSHVLRPSLADRQGRALFIGTPKGRNHLYDYFELAKSNPDWQSFQFTTEEGGLVTKDELASAGREMDANVFRQEFDAQFTSLGQHRAYLSFDRAANVREVRFAGDHPLAWSLDFNVDPMCMLLLQKVGDDINVLEEMIVRPDATTEKACLKLIGLIDPYTKLVHFGHAPLQLHIYGDASGHQRRTAGATTDWTQIRDFFRMHIGSIQPSYFLAGANPLIRDRVNCVNARLRNKDGEPRLFVSPGCKELIRDLEEVAWSTDSTGAPTRDLNKKDRGRTHLSDALGYFVSQAFPMRPTAGEKAGPLL